MGSGTGEVTGLGVGEGDGAPAGTRVTTTLKTTFSVVEVCAASGAANRSNAKASFMSGLLGELLDAERGAADGDGGR